MNKTQAKDDYLRELLRNELTYRRPFGYKSNKDWLQSLNDKQVTELSDKLYEEYAYKQSPVWGQQLWTACYIKGAYHPVEWKDEPQYNPIISSDEE